jgi:hypothetical protein
MQRDGQPVQNCGRQGNVESGDVGASVEELGKMSFTADWAHGSLSVPVFNFICEFESHGWSIEHHEAP